ncbi:hypothetical protein ACLOJK_031248 [Asimina triloba]
MSKTENNLVLMAVGFAASTIFIVFVCTRLICAQIMQWTASRQAILTARPRSRLGTQLERGLHGLEPVVVATFPTKKFSDEFFSASEDTQCTVCLADYEGKDTLRILPYCGHYFHVSCIDLWLKQNSTCPVCRISLRESVKRNRMMPPVLRMPLRTSPQASGSLNAHWYSSEAVGNPQGELVQADRFPSDIDTVEVVEGSATLTADNNVVRKSISNCVLEGKRVESPSNA